MYNTDYQKWNTNIKAGKQDGEDRTKQNISYKSVDLDGDRTVEIFLYTVLRLQGRGSTAGKKWNGLYRM